jgi:hypothetical protein
VRINGDCPDKKPYFCHMGPKQGQRHAVVRKGRGVETNSVSADPMFMDVKKGDLRLKTESAALKLGFEAWDVKTAGLRTRHP